MKNYFIIFLFALVLPCSSCQDDESKEKIQETPVQTNNPLISQLDKDIHNHVRVYISTKKIIGLSIGVFKNGTFQQYGYGETALGNGKIPGENTVFEINSLSKAITSIMLTNTLLNEGFTIDEPASTFLPSSIPTLTENGQEIVIRHLLNHTSGLPELPLNISGGWSNMDALEAYDSTDLYSYLENFNLPYTPGTQYAYSNTGFGLAGIILERMTDKSYEENLIEQFCNPLGLSKTSIAINEANDNAKGYNSVKNEIDYIDKIDALKGSVAVRSTVKDLITYGRINLDAGTSPLKEALKICQAVSFDQPKVGLDWEYMMINGNEVLMHIGGVASFNSAIYLCKSKNSVVVLLSNTDLGDDGGEFTAIVNGLASLVIN